MIPIAHVYKHNTNRDHTRQVHIYKLSLELAFNANFCILNSLVLLVEMTYLI